jgi:glutathionylspermidine synthase
MIFFISNAFWSGSNIWFSRVVENFNSSRTDYNYSIWITSPTRSSFLLHCDFNYFVLQLICQKYNPLFIQIFLIIGWIIDVTSEGIILRRGKEVDRKNNSNVCK